MAKYALVVALLVGLSIAAFARDDGRYADDPLKYWFDHLSDGAGECVVHSPMAKFIECAPTTLPKLPVLPSTRAPCGSIHALTNAVHVL